MSKKYNFVYKTTNNINGDYYYGVHSTNNLDDGYLGSGLRLNRSINKYGESNFTREIVQYFSNVKNAYSLERAIVTPELLLDKHCLNIATGGNGGYIIECFSDEHKKAIYNKMAQSKKGIHLSELHKQSIRETLKGRLPWNKGKTNCYSEESRKKMSEKGKERTFTDETRNKISKAKRGVLLSEKAKNNISNGTIKGMQQKMLEDSTFRDKLVEGGKHTKGLIWINNGHNCKRVNKEEIDIFLNNGWQLGRIKINK